MSHRLPPGFRFHPTDEELVSYYLKRKNFGKKIEFNAIGTIDLYKYEPWDLPDMSLLQTKDLEWYFFNPRDRKFANSSRANRATEKGYWKATGKDRSIMSSSKHVGMKKTLVYYSGRAPKGERTNWVMHEYRLSDTECERLHSSQNSYVLCRIYQKRGLGSRNGEQYGAPVEDDDDSEEIKHCNPMDCKDKISDGPHVDYTIFGGENYIETKKEDSCGIKSGVLPSSVLTKPSGGGSVTGARDLSSFESEESILQELYQLVASNSDNSVDAGVCDTSLDTPASDGGFLELDDLFPISDEDENRKIMYEFSESTFRLPKQQESTDFQPENMAETSQCMKQDSCIKSGGLPDTAMTEPSGAECLTGSRCLSSIRSEESMFEELYQLVSSNSGNDVNADVCSTALNCPASNGDFLELDDLFQGSDENKKGNEIYEEFPELLSSNLYKQQEAIEHGGFVQSRISSNASELRSMVDAVDVYSNGNHQSNVLQTLLRPAENTPGVSHQFGTTRKLQNSGSIEFLESLDELFVEENRSLDVGLAENLQGSFQLQSGSLPDAGTSFKDAQHFEVLQHSESHMRDIDSDASYQNENPTFSNYGSNQQEIGHLLAETKQQRTLMSSFLSYLENLPAFPASAADLPSEEVSTSERLKFVRQLSMRAAQQKLEHGSSVRFFIIACLVAVWAIFWMLMIAGGARKLVDVLNKFMHSSYKRLN